MFYSTIKAMSLSFELHNILKKKRKEQEDNEETRQIDSGNNL